MALTIEQYSALGRDTNGQLVPIPNAEAFISVIASGVVFNANTSFIVVTSDADDLIAIGLDGSEGTPSIPVATNVPRPFTVPRGKGWACTI